MTAAAIGRSVLTTVTKRLVQATALTAKIKIRRKEATAAARAADIFLALGSGLLIEVIVFISIKWIVNIVIKDLPLKAVYSNMNGPRPVRPPVLYAEGSYLVVSGYSRIWKEKYVSHIKKKIPIINVQYVKGRFLLNSAYSRI